VMNTRLADRPFLAGEYSIADMASYPWVVPHELQGQKIGDFPHLKRWLDAIAARPAVQRGLQAPPRPDDVEAQVDAARKILV
jgi:GST-like protein